MKEKLFNFLTIRHIKSIPANKIGSGLEISTSVVATFESTTHTLEQKQTYLDSLKPQYLHGSLKGHSPELDALASAFKEVGYRMSPADASTAIKGVFKDELLNILADSDHQYKFGRVNIGVVVNALETGEVPPSLVKGRQLIGLIEALSRNELSTDAEVQKAFATKLNLPPSVADFLREKKDAERPGPQNPSEPGDDNLKELEELNKELAALDKVLADTTPQKPTDVVPKMMSTEDSKSRMTFEPTFKIEFSTAKWDSFGVETVDFISKSGMKQEEVSVDGLRAQVEEARDEIAIKMADLAGPAVEPMVFLNGQVQSIQSILAKDKLSIIGEPTIASFLEGPKYMRPLGIGDLKTVEQVDVRYAIGEIAHIENVLAGESKVRDHLRESSRETFEETESSSSESTFQERQTSESQELAQASQKAVKTKMDFDFAVHTKSEVWPGVEIKTDTSLGLDRSKEASRQESSKFAREVVEKAVSSIQESVRERRSQTTIKKITERNTHTLNNTGDGNGHMVGIYRWLNKKYTARVRTHGARMLYEFIVPEPGAFHIFAEAKRSQESIQLKAPQPPQTNGDKPRGLKASDLNSSNYRYYATQYNVGNLSRPPQRELILSKAVTIDPSSNKDMGAFTKEFSFQIPEGYVPGMVLGAGNLIHNTERLNLIAHVGKKRVAVQGLSAEEVSSEGGDKKWVLQNNFTISDWLDFYGNVFGKLPLGVAVRELPVSMVVYNARGLSMTMAVVCTLSKESYEAWQNQSYQRIMAAYLEMKSDYEERLRGLEFSKGVQISGKNPLHNKEIMETELKKHCISFMTNSYLERYQSMFRGSEKDSPPQIDFEKAFHNGSRIQFFEQAFEWSNMMHQFYPYFWTGNENWPLMRDHDSSDPEFGKFLRAGAARVILSVRKGYEDAVAFYMNTFIVPSPESGITIGDNLFVDIVDLLREEQDAEQGTLTDDEWEVTLPTNLVVLDDDDAIQRVERVIP